MTVIRPWPWRRTHGVLAIEAPGQRTWQSECRGKGVRLSDVIEAQPDAVLVRAVAARSEPALREIHRRYGGAVHALARRVTADAHLADDVSQTVFVRLWEEPDRFDHRRGTLRGWLLAQAHGRSVDLVRNELARRRRQETEAHRARPGTDDVEGLVGDSLLAEGVRRALAELPDQERRAIELAYFGGHSYRDVAVILGAPEGTVKSRIRAGLLRLRASLEATGATG
jgi:RNA polymerase sigma-70 factor (ECF subfamily)